LLRLAGFGHDLVTSWSTVTESQVAAIIQQLVADSAVATLATFTLAEWRRRQRQPIVSHSIETGWKGPWICNLENLGEGKLQIEHLIITTAIPSDGRLCPRSSVLSSTDHSIGVSASALHSVGCAILVSYR
jgi:hypothetical protein